MFGRPHGHSHAVSVELDPVVGCPLVLGWQKIMGLPKHAASSSPNPRPWEDCPSSLSPGPNDHPGDTADAMCDAEGWDPRSWPGGDCSGGDSSEEDEDLEAKAACALFQDAGMDLMEGCEPAETPGEPYASGHFSEEELKDLDEIHHDIENCVGNFAKHHHHSPTSVLHKLNLAFVTQEHHTAGNPWDAFLTLNQNTGPSMKQRVSTSHKLLSLHTMLLLLNMEGREVLPGRRKPRS